jgi:hypothetical protein
VVSFGPVPEDLIMADDFVPPPVDRRASTRQSANIPAALLCDDWSIFALVDDVSDSGALLLTQEPIEAGTKVEVRVLLGSLVNPPVKGAATVVRSKRREGGAQLWSHEVAIQSDSREGPWDEALGAVVQRQANLRRTDV